MRGGPRNERPPLAKDILAEALELKLPAVIAELDDEVIVVSSERILQFDRAVLKDRLGDLIPDVVLHIGERRLLVEVRVTLCLTGLAEQARTGRR